MPDNRNLTDAFVAARNAYPRPVWHDNAMWRLIEHNGNKDLLILSEQKKQQYGPNTHDFYTMPKREMERAQRPCPVCAFFGKKPERIGFDYGSIGRNVEIIPVICCNECAQYVAEDHLEQKVLAWLAKQPQERKGA